ncbi:MAG: RIP metalloprotease RseP [Firmicutes bacterium]|nr:RIP metalloprotease RseP [Bacillota bacterium]
MTALAFVLVFGLLTTFHEVGHFTVAKLMGIRVEEFGIGFGTQIFSHKRGETLYSLRLLPLGGFVKMSGEDTPAPSDARSYNNKSVLTRIAVIAAGPFMNLVLAVILFGLIFFISGVPEQAPLVGGIIADSPAQGAGLQIGDEVLSINGQEVETWEQMALSIQEGAGERIRLTVARQDETFIVELRPEPDPETGINLIGVERVIRRYRPLTSVYYGFLQTVEAAIFIITMLAGMITGRIAPELSGPVGIIQTVGEAARTGFLDVLFLAAILSINIALFNFFPIPMLDGGQLLFLTVEGIRGKPLRPEQEGFFRFIGILLLLLLLVAVTYSDITRLLLS